MRNPRHVGVPSELTIVIKLGTSSIVNEATFQPQLALLSAITETICSLRTLGHRVVLVSSGAIGMGLKRMELKKRPKALQEKQALAAIGQGRLIALWDNLFSMLGQPIAQVLLTRNDISDRSRYLNSTRTLASLLSYGVVPIVNENDTVSVSEIKFGDNDTLSAIAAGMVQADYLFLLTDVDCLYTENPRRYPDTAKPVRVVRDIEKVRELVSTATLGSSLGTGGMETKLIAAELATGAGVATVITHGMHPSNILEIVSQSRLLHSRPSSDQEPPNPSEAPESAMTPLEGANGDGEEEYCQKTPLHTLFVPKETPLSDRRWWVVHGLKPRGRIVIDEGAYRAIARSTSTASTSTGQPLASTSAGSTPSSSVILPPRGRSEATARSAPGTPARSNSASNVASSSSSGNGGRLLPAGVIAVEGVFAAGQAVTIAVRRKRRSRRDRENSGGRSCDDLARSAASRSSSPSSHRANGNSNSSNGDARDPHQPDEEQDAWEDCDCGQGLANYNSQEIDRIKGHRSDKIEKILGYMEGEHCVDSITTMNAGL